MARQLTRRDFLKAGAAALPVVAGLSRASGAESAKLFTSWEDIIDERDFSIKVAKPVLDFFRREWDVLDTGRPEEDFFILLANQKTGVIDMATNAFSSKSKDGCGAEKGFFKYLDDAARAHGHFVVGHYHAHPSPPGKGKCGDLLSADDLPRGRDRDSNILRFLGHGSDVVPFSTRAFLPLVATNIGGEHRYVRNRSEYEDRWRYARTQYPNPDEREDKRVVDLRVREVDASLVDAMKVIPEIPGFQTSHHGQADKGVFRDLYRLLGGEDEFAFTDPETRCDMSAKLRHDDRLVLSFLAKDAQWSPDNHCLHSRQVNIVAEGDKVKMDYRKEYRSYSVHLEKIDTDRLGVLLKKMTRGFPGKMRERADSIIVSK